MTTFLNQIFYKSNKFDHIKSLEKYMLNCHNMEILKSNNVTQDINISELSVTPSRIPKFNNLILEKKIEPCSNNNSTPIIDLLSIQSLPTSFPEFSVSAPSATPPLLKIKKTSDIYYPNKEDSLFWCIFISFYGWKEYEFIGKKYANRELEEKQKIMENIKKMPANMKQTNIKVTNVLIQEILSDLLINKKTSLNTFLAFVSYYKKKVFIVRKNTYLSYNYDNTGFQDYIDNTMNYVIIYYNIETQKYGIDMDVNHEKVKNIIENKFMLSSILKPLKGASTYKVCELEEIAKKINLTLNPLLQTTSTTSSEFNASELSAPPLRLQKKIDLYTLIYNDCLFL